MKKTKVVTPKISRSESEGDNQYPNVNLHDLRHDKAGREHLDPTPMQPPLGYKRQPSLAEQIRTQVAAHHAALRDHEPESLEEADDFDIDDEVDPHSKWENDFEPSVKELKARALQRQAEEEVAARPPPLNTAPSPLDPPEPAPKPHDGPA